LATTIRKLRVQRGWTQPELAARANLSKSFVSEMETGKKPNPRGATLQKLAAAFGLTTDELLGAAPRASTIPPQSVRWGSVVTVPIVNVTMAAGQAYYGETGDAVPVAAELAISRTLVASRVTGNCMEPEIMDGDLAIVDISQQHPPSGSLVAVLMEDGNMMVKRYEVREDGSILLDNKGGEYRPNGAKIQGQVVAMNRTFAKVGR